MPVSRQYRKGKVINGECVIKPAAIMSDRSLIQGLSGIQCKILDKGQRPWDTYTFMAVSHWLRNALEGMLISRHIS